jgi:hypothetical protein
MFNQGWTLETGFVKGDPNAPYNMVPCGYTVELYAWDLAIINSQDSPRGNQNAARQGFCLRAAKGTSEWDVCEVLDA